MRIALVDRRRRNPRLGFVSTSAASVLERRLGSVATQLAGRHVHVHCQGSPATARRHRGGRHRAVRRDGRPADVTDLKRPICKALAASRTTSRAGFGCVSRRPIVRTQIFEDVLAVHTLAHESWHLRGDEERSRHRVLRAADHGVRGDAARRRPRPRRPTANYALLARLPEQARRVPVGAVRERRAAGPAAHRPALAVSLYGTYRRDVRDLAVDDLCAICMHLRRRRPSAPSG